jgi:hypothetical protein
MHSIFMRALTVSAMLMLPAGAFAQDDAGVTFIGASQDWSIFQADAPSECWAVTMPRDSTHLRNGQPADVVRDDVRLFITRSEEGLELSFAAGYPIDVEAGVALTVKGQDFALVAEGETAWARDAAQQAEIITQMKRAGVLRITAQSESGTRTDDSFSMMGLTAALEQAIDACS